MFETLVFNGDGTYTHFDSSTSTTYYIDASLEVTDDNTVGEYTDENGVVYTLHGTDTSFSRFSYCKTISDNYYCKNCRAETESTKSK